MLKLGLSHLEGLQHSNIAKQLISLLDQLHLELVT
jgi:hypothetical protein